MSSSMQTMDDTIDIPGPKRHQFEPDDTSDFPSPKEYFSKQATSFGVSEWIQFSRFFSVDSLFEKACTYANDHLALRYYLLGNDFMSVADVVVASSLHRTGQRWLSLMELEKFQYLGSLYLMVLAQHKLRIKHKITTPGPLPDANVGEVCLRFSPKLTQVFDIQHVRAALLHHHYAIRYQGQLIVRFEDINPTEGSTELVDNLLKDLKTLGVKYAVVSYTSDYFPQLIKMAESLILKGKAYVDNTPQEQMRKEMVHGIESKCRNHSPEENMELWKEMIAGSDVGRKCYLRGKLDMQHPNNYLRDPVYYLCSPIPHHRTGTEFKVYPTDNFSCPYIDAAQTISHVLRSTYHKKKFPLYYRILEDMGFSKIQIFEFKLLQIVYTPSAHQLQWFVKNKEVEGWHDPRLPTVQGLVRRGVKIDALKVFLYQQGVSKNSLIEWDRLWSINNEMLETQVCSVHTAVIEEKCVKLRLTNVPDDKDNSRHTVDYVGKHAKVMTFSKDILLEKADASLLSEGDEISLMDWGTAIVEVIKRDKDGNVTMLSGYLNGAHPFKSTKYPLVWLPVTDELVHLSLVKFDYLITKKKLEAGEDFLDVLNPCTKEERPGLGNPDMRKLNHGEIVLLDMKGYYRCDVPFVDDSTPMVLFAIPDGQIWEQV